MKVLFLAPSVITPTVLRSASFARVLGSEHDTILAGPAEAGVANFLEDHRFKILRLESQNLLLRIAQAFKEATYADVVVACDARTYSCICGIAARLLGRRYIFDLGDDPVEMISFEMGLVRQRPWHSRRFVVSSWIRRLIVATALLSRRFSNVRIVASTHLRTRYGGVVLPAPEEEDPSTLSGPEAKRYLGLDPADYVIGWVGTVRAHKGLLILLDAFHLVSQSLPHAKLLIAGSLIEAEKSYTANRVLDAAKRDGRIVVKELSGRAELLSAMKASDCLINCNPDNPVHRLQAPMKLIDYMASGRPIIATDVGDTRRILGPEGGILVPPDNRERLADAILYLQSRPLIGHEISKNAKERFRQHYSSEAVRPILRRLYAG